MEEENKNKQASVDVTEIPTEEQSLKERPRLERNASAQAVIKTDDWWLWELAGILISLAALAGIGALLSTLDDKPQPFWAYTTPAKKVAGKTIPAVTVAVSPNSILSLLSTIGRICVLIPITKGLAQLKWVWFAEQERMLSDFEAFENATRGVTGSLFLVWKLKFRHFAVVGAAAVLLALAFDPFVQNLLSYYSRNVLDSELPAQLSRATEYVGGNQYVELGTSMKSSIIAGFSHAPNFDVPDYYCASGNCTWQNTPTLGVCSRCADVSRMLLKQCNQTTATLTTSTSSCKYSLPNGFSLSAHPNPSINFAANVSINDRFGGGYPPLVYANYTHPLARMYSIYGDGEQLGGYYSGITPKTKVYATECALVPCIQLYNSAVGTSANGLHGGVVSSFNDKVIAEYDNYMFNDSRVFSLNGVVPNNTGAWMRPNNELFGNDTYHISADSMAQITDFLGLTVPGVVQNSIDNQGAPFFMLPGDAGIYGASLFLQNVFTADPATTCNRNEHSGNWEALRFQCAVENMARAITVNIRNSFFSKATLGLTGSEDKDVQTSPLIALGGTMVSKTFISVTWYWLILPIVLWILAVVMFVGTVWKTRKAGVRTWRTSTLAPLFLGLGIRDDQKQKVEQHPMTADGLQKKAEEIKVQLHLTEQDAKLVGG